MITRLEINNYRCLRYNKLNLPPFAALVGPNTSGKNTFIDALRFLPDLMEQPVDRVLFFNGRSGAGRCSTFNDLLFNGIGRHFEIAAEIRIPEDVRHGTFTKARYEVEMGLLNENDEVHILNETLLLIPKENDRHLNNERTSKQREMFPAVDLDEQKTLLVAPDKKKSPKGWRKSVNKTETGNDYFGSETTKWNNLFKVGPKKSALANLIDD